MPVDLPVQLNIAERFLDRHIAEGRADRVALRTPERNWSYGEVHALAEGFAELLRNQRVERGERILVALPDGAAFVGAIFGILKVGAVVVMVNPRLQAEALRHLFDDSRAAVILVGEGAAAACAEAMTLGERNPQRVDAAKIATLEATALEAVGERPSTTLGTNREDPAFWLFSGGTTGKPKAVVQPHRSFANTTELYARRALGYREDDIALSVPKLFFGYATGSNLLFPFAVGASAVLFPEHPTAEILFEQVRRHRPTILINVPTMVGQMVAHPAAVEQDLSCLRFATSAGEALPVPLHERWRETFGVELLDGLGTAEMWHVFVTNLPGAVRPGTLGQAVPGFEVEVRGPDGQSLPDGEIGRLWVGGNSAALEYWGDPEKSAEAFRDGGFLAGDLVCRDGDGYFTYCGRGDDCLKVGGKWLAPQEVESCLMRHPAVVECAVVGVENATGLVKPLAAVRVKDGSTEEAGGDDALEQALKDHVLDALEPYKHPRRVIRLEEFPRTHLGKIDRGALKRRLEEIQA
ncbi:MAG: benzoate-CoA ligase family protein [Acidobacteriota bacterium]